MAEALDWLRGSGIDDAADTVVDGLTRAVDAANRTAGGLWLLGGDRVTQIADENAQIGGLLEAALGNAPVLREAAEVVVRDRLTKAGVAVTEDRVRAMTDALEQRIREHMHDDALSEGLALPGFGAGTFAPARAAGGAAANAIGDLGAPSVSPGAIARKILHLLVTEQATTQAMTAASAKLQQSDPTLWRTLDGSSARSLPGQVENLHMLWHWVEPELSWLDGEIERSSASARSLPQS